MFFLNRLNHKKSSTLSAQLSSAQLISLASSISLPLSVRFYQLLCSLTKSKWSTTLLPSTGVSVDNQDSWRFPVLMSTTTITWPHHRHRGLLYFLTMIRWLHSKHWLLLVPMVNGPSFLAAKSQPASLIIQQSRSQISRPPPVRSKRQEWSSLPYLPQPFLSEE